MTVIELSFLSQYYELGVHGSNAGSGDWNNFAITSVIVLQAT